MAIGSNSGGYSLRCPRCGQQDSVQSVRSLVDSGVGTTSGVALSAPLMPHSHLIGTGFVSRTVTQMAKRLGPPSPPKVKFLKPFLITFSVLVGVVIAFIILSNVAAGNFSLQLLWIGLIGGIGWSFSIFLVPILVTSAIVALITRPFQKKLIHMRLQTWSVRAGQVLSASYCIRDDTMFDQTFAGSPESFKNQIFGA